LPISRIEVASSSEKNGAKVRVTKAAPKQRQALAQPAASPCKIMPFTPYCNA
jgi:hypothetical protein